MKIRDKNSSHPYLVVAVVVVVVVMVVTVVVVVVVLVAVISGVTKQSEGEVQGNCEHEHEVGGYEVDTARRQKHEKKRQKPAKKCWFSTEIRT